MRRNFSDLDDRVERDIVLQKEKEVAERARKKEEIAKRKKERAEREAAEVRRLEFGRGRSESYPNVGMSR